MIIKIVLNEYSYLELLNFENIINFKVLLIENFEYKHFAIFCIPIDKCF